VWQEGPHPPHCPDGDKKDEKSGEKRDEKPDEKSRPGKESEKAADKMKSASGTLYTAISHSALLTTGDSTKTFYVDSGASDHLIPSRGELRAYQEFAKPVEISAAKSGKIYAYGSGTLRVATSANGLGREADLQDVYYAPGVHARLVSLGKLEGQGWDVRLRDGGMELCDRDGDLVANVAKVNNVYPVGLTVIPPMAGFAAWTTGSEDAEQTHEDLVGRLVKVAMVATAKGADGMRATLMTWHRRLGHPSFKTVVALARSGANGMVITDLPTKIPSLDTCAACVAAKSVHFPHKEGRNRAGEYLGRVHIDVAGPMPMKSAGGKEYEYVIVDDYSRAVYTRPLRLKSEAAEVFKIFKAAAENESQKTMREVMTDNARELSMGEVKEICEREGIKLHTSVRYNPESNEVAEHTIGVLTNAVRAMLHDSGLPRYLWAEAFNAATYVHNRTPTRALGGRTPYEVIYGTKPDVSHLRAFGAPCAIVEPQQRLKKLDDRATMCFFVGYKYEGGGYRVWDPKRRVVLESRDVVFFEDGLPPPTLNNLSSQLVDDDEPVTQPVPKPIIEPATSPDAVNASAPPATAPTTLPEAAPESLPTPTPYPRITIRLPGRGMNRPGVSTVQPTTRPWTLSPTRSRSPMRIPAQSQFTTFRSCTITPRGRCIPASYAMEEGGVGARTHADKEEIERRL
jgi:transposase InsO family protein